MNTQSDEKQILIQLIGESVLNSLQKEGVQLVISSELEKSSSSSSPQNDEESDEVYQRVLHGLLSLTSELEQMYRDELRRRNRLRF